MTNAEHYWSYEAGEIQRRKEAYEAKAWGVEAFMVSWHMHQDCETWEDFYWRMAQDCDEQTGTIPSETDLNTRLRLCEQHFKRKHITPPRRPERPRTSPYSLLEMAQRLGLSGAAEALAEEEARKKSAS